MRLILQYIGCVFDCLIGSRQHKRKARFTALQFAHDHGCGRDETIGIAQGYYLFLLTGEHIAASAAE